MYLYDSLVTPHKVKFDPWVRYLRVLYFRFERMIDLTTKCFTNIDIYHRDTDNCDKVFFWINSI